MMAAAFACGREREATARGVGVPEVAIARWRTDGAQIRRSRCGMARDDAEAIELI